MDVFLLVYDGFLLVFGVVFDVFFFFKGVWDGGGGRFWREFVFFYCFCFVFLQLRRWFYGAFGVVNGKSVVVL